MDHNECATESSVVTQTVVEQLVDRASELAGNITKLEVDVGERVRLLVGSLPAQDACPDPPVDESSFGCLNVSLGLIDMARIRINGYLQHLDKGNI